MVTSGPPCPSCGVAVVPGYVKCPRCHAQQPRVRRTSIQPGGTAVITRDRFPIAPVIGGVVVALVIALFFGLRGSHAAQPEAVAAPIDDTGEDDPARAPQPIPGAIPPSVTAPVAANAKPPPPPQPSPQAAINELDRKLRAQRLWASVTIDGSALQVRSASCGESELTSALSDSSAALRESGLTKLRCVEQSGRVVFERDL